MSHTKGRLTTNGPEIYREDGTQVCFIELVFPFEECSADARRLVACWNACNGLSTESLEIMPDTLNQTFSLVNTMQERDELVKALRRQYNADAKLYCAAHNIDKEDYEALLSEHDASHSAIAEILARHQEGK